MDNTIQDELITDIQASLGPQVHGSIKDDILLRCLYAFHKPTALVAAKKRGRPSGAKTRKAAADLLSSAPNAAEQHTFIGDKHQ